MRLGILLYEDFEILDAYGPAEMFGSLGKDCELVIVAEKAGNVKSYQGPRFVADYGLDDCPHLDLLLVPGGFGTLPQLENEKLVAWIQDRARTTDITMSVCSGSSLLAKAGLLDENRATTNKQFYTMLTAPFPDVEWVPVARWVDSDHIVTSSGVSAGCDMALAVIARLFGEERANQIAELTEYNWHRDADSDPFAKDIK